MTYPDDFINKVICGDCLEVMKQMPDKSVDCVITDPPYGIDLGYASYEDSREALSDLVQKVMPEILRVSKRSLITCGVSNIGLYPKPDWILSWVSSAGIGSGPWGFCCWQPILAYGKDPYLQNKLGRKPDIFQSNERSEDNGHPCPKPFKLWKQIMARASVDENDIILDPFLGSGTTAVAAKLLNRRYIGIEIEPKYCAIAEQRLAQQTLGI